MKLLPLLTFLLPAALFAQGDLPPPAGAPVASMRTLTQIEPRTPIPASPTPSIAGPHFTINTPGSYYLTGNVTVTSGNGINISSVSGVTLDLNGFTISSTHGSGSGTAIYLTSVSNVTIHNGHIISASTSGTPKGFFNGIDWTGNKPTNTEVHHLSVSGIGNIGINGPSVVRDCNLDNIGFTGINATTVSDCMLSEMAASGIQASLVTKCKVTLATSSSGTGINAGTVTDCIADSRTSIGIDGINVSNSKGSSISGIGIDGNTVSNCYGSSSTGSGITGTNVTNSVGVTGSAGTAGISATGTVSFSRGDRAGGNAITAVNAIGCTANGTVTATNKSLGTP